MLNMSMGGSPRKGQILALIMAVFATVLLAAAQVRADTPKPDPKHDRGLKDAPKLITDTGVPCDMVDAMYIGSGSTTKDGKTITGDTYEVSCKPDIGYFLTRFSSGGTDRAFNCLQAEARLIGAKDPKTVLLCTLPGSSPTYSFLNPVVKPILADCTVSKARWLGYFSGSKMSRYEVQCTSGNGGIFDIPEYDNPTGKLAFHDCLQVENSKSKCIYLSHEDAVKSFAALAKSADAACQIKDMRFLGGSAEDDNYYYEVGCNNQPGYVLVAGGGLKFKAVASCEQATQLNGGCKWTDVTTLAAQHKAAYQDALAKGGVACTVQDYDLQGVDKGSKRELVEFKCPERPFGLVALIPMPGATRPMTSYDCFGIKAIFGRDCEYVTPETLQAQIVKVAKTDRRVLADCVIREVRYAGTNTKEELLVEIACVNLRGYILLVSADRNKVMAVEPCIEARKNKDDEQCTIPNNGTYVAPKI